MVQATTIVVTLPNPLQKSSFWGKVISQLGMSSRFHAWIFSQEPYFQSVTPQLVTDILQGL